MRRRTPPARWPQLRLLQLRSSDRAVREHLRVLCDDDIAATEADEDAARERNEIDALPPDAATALRRRLRHQRAAEATR